MLDPDLEISYLLSYNCRSFPKEGKRYCCHKKTMHVTVRYAHQGGAISIVLMCLPMTDKSLLVWRHIKGSLSSDVSSHGRHPEVGFLHSQAVILNNFFRQIVSIRVKTLSHTNLVALKHIKREKGSLPVDVRRSKTELLKLPKNGRELRVAYTNLQGTS